MRGSTVHLYTYTLFTCRCSMDVSQLVTDRLGVLQVCIHLHVFTGVYCAVVYTHMTVHLFYRCLRGSNISNITF